MAEKQLGRNLTVEEINHEWHEAKLKGFIDSENNLRNAAKVATNCLRRYGGSGSLVEVATRFDGETEWYSWVTPRKADYRIMKINQNGPNKTHFVVVDKTNKVVFEPHDPPIHSLGEVYTVLYRYDGERK